jgi:hypothetical protein
MRGIQEVWILHTSLELSRSRGGTCVQEEARARSKGGTCAAFQKCRFHEWIGKAAQSCQVSVIFFQPYYFPWPMCSPSCNACLVQSAFEVHKYVRVYLPVCSSLKSTDVLMSEVIKGSTQTHTPVWWTCACSALKPARTRQSPWNYRFPCKLYMDFLYVQMYEIWVHFDTLNGSISICGCWDWSLISYITHRIWPRFWNVYILGRFPAKGTACWTV